MIQVIFRSPMTRYPRKVTRPLLLMGFVFCSWPAFAEYTAILRPLDEVTVASNQRGIVETILVEAGTEVRAGKRLAALINEEQELALRRANKVLDKRRYDFEGGQQLFSQEVISEQEFRDLEAKWELAKVDRDQARVQFEQTRFTAPLDGVVAERHISEGEWVQPGSELFTLVYIDTLYAEIYLDPATAASLDPKTQATLSVSSDPDLQREAVLDFVDPRVDASSALQRVRFRVPNPDHRLPPGLSVELRIP